MTEQGNTGILLGFFLETDVLHKLVMKTEKILQPFIVMEVQDITTFTVLYTAIPLWILKPNVIINWMLLSPNYS
jgi:hypothetical protein